MRRHRLYLFLLLLGGLLAPLVAHSYRAPAVSLLIDTPRPIAVTLSPVSPNALQSSLPAPGNSCELAAPATFVYPSDLLATGSHLVNSYGTAPSDPLLSCLADSIYDTRGLRSAWYSVVAPVGGLLNVRTVSDAEYRRNYDTVIAIHTGTCGSLTELTCNDDNYALLSNATAEVVEGETYYIEVVAYSQAGNSLPPVLNVEAEIIPTQTWSSANQTLLAPLTGHAVVMDGPYAYIIGGLTDLFSPFWSGGNRSGSVYRYDTRTGETVELSRMAATGGNDSSGYAFTDAILVNGQIHLPTGFVGTDGSYDGSHWVYNIENDLWRIYSPSQGQIDPPWGPNPGQNVPGWTAMTEHLIGNERGFFVTGGLLGQFRGGANANPANTVYQYKEVNGTPSWTLFPTMVRARYAHTAVRLPSGASYRICVVGGLTEVAGGDALLEGGECYFPDGVSPDFIPGWYETVGALNIPRYMAESVLGPDGRWYVLGGIDQSGNYVAETEVFDPNSGTWSISPSNRSLAAPPLAWTRGGFVGNRLWLFGGQQPGGPVPVPIIQSLIFTEDPTLFPVQYYMPLVYGGFSNQASLLYAQQLTRGVPQRAVFSNLGDAYHVYSIDFDQPGEVRVQLRNIQPGYNYDVLLYDADKRLHKTGTNLGTISEDFIQVLAASGVPGGIPPGRLYIIVVRNAPNTPPSSVPYDLLVTFLPS